MQSIRAKLVLASTIVVGFILFQSATAFYLVNANNQLVSRTVDNEFSGSLLIAQMAIEAQKIRRFEKELFIYVDNEAKRKKYEQEWKEAYLTLRQLTDTLLDTNSTLWSTDERQQFVEWERSLSAYGNGFLNVVNRAASGEFPDSVSANAAIKDAKNAFRVLLNGTTEGGAIKYQRAHQAIDAVEQNSRLLTLVIAGVGVAGILFMLVFLVAISRSITRPIAALAQAADDMSRGNLETEISPPAGAREFGLLAQTLERLRISQKTMLARLRK